MKKHLLFLLIFLFVAIAAKADTVDNWHVYYNGTTIFNSNEIKSFSDDTITLKIKDIKSTDTITVIYYSDGVCSSCLAVLSIRGSNDPHYLMNAKTQGSYNPLSFPVSALLKNSNAYFNIDYCMDEKWCNDMKFNRFTLFTIKLE